MRIFAWSALLSIVIKQNYEPLLRFALVWPVVTVTSLRRFRRPIGLTHEGKKGKEI